MIPTGKKYENKDIAYEILNDGYMIYLDGKPWVKQREPHGKPMDPGKSYEENCLLQIDEIISEAQQEQRYTLDEAAALLAQEVNA